MRIGAVRARIRAESWCGGCPGGPSIKEAKKDRFIQNRQRVLICCGELTIPLNNYYPNTELYYPKRAYASCSWFHWEDASCRVIEEQVQLHHECLSFPRLGSPLKMRQQLWWPISWDLHILLMQNEKYNNFLPLKSHHEPKNVSTRVSIISICYLSSLLSLSY